MDTRTITRALAIAALTLCAHRASASCGAATCTLMSDRYTLDSGTGRSGFSLDLRFEFVDQDRLRTGTRKARPEDIAGEEALERRTRQRGVIASIDYGFDADWSLQVRLPLLQREHLHAPIDEDTGEVSGEERWRFTAPGDTQLTLRRRFSPEGGDTVFAVYAGLKLPTGSRHEENSDGARAERSLQPGTGTTDIVAGVAARRSIALHDVVFAQAGVTRALSGVDGFEPGKQYGAGVGWSHAFGPHLGSVLQLNLQHRGRDAGHASEPEVSGGTTVDLSPGLTWSPRPGSTVYAYVQLPLLHDVNGTQLVRSRTLALGWSLDF